MINQQCQDLHEEDESNKNVVSSASNHQAIVDRDNQGEDAHALSNIIAFPQISDVTDITTANLEDTEREEFNPGSDDEQVDDISDEEDEDIDMNELKDVMQKCSKSKKRM